MTRRRAGRALPFAALAGAFCAGFFVEWWLHTYGPPRPVTASAEVRLEADSTRTAPPRIPPRATIEAAPTPGDAPRGSLRMPLDNSSVEAMKGGFVERRGSQPHEAVDLLAPRNTPVHAVANGSIARLFLSKAGGITIYQFDVEGRHCYYYAHLEGYASGLHEGQVVSQGDVIGYVGTTGNAPPQTPHLHFAVMELDAKRQWWKGKSIDPYPFFRDRVKPADGRG